jgi:O-antigen ligase
VARVRGLWPVVALGVGLGALSVVFTFSRAAVLTALIAIALGVLVSGARYRRWLLLVLVVAAVGVGTLVGTCGSDSTAGYGRGEEWRQTMEVVGDYPVTGVGLGRLGFVLTARNEKSTARHAHNLFLTWWAEAGTGALVAWLWLFGLLLWRTLRGALRGMPGAAAAFVAVVGFLGFSLLDHPANTDRVALAFWIVAGWAAASGPPAWSLLGRLRRGSGREPDEGLGLAAETDIRGRPRTGNVRTVPRGPGA